MEGPKTVEDLLRSKGVTPEEAEQLAEIIEECRLREVRIKEASDAARQNVESLADTLKMIFDTFTFVKKSVGTLQDEVERLQLKMMPEEHFYRE